MNKKVNQNQTLLVAQLRSDGWQGQSQLHANI